MSTPPASGPNENADGAALCALLQQLRRNGGLSYDELAQVPGLSRGTAVNYITKPGHRRDATTLALLLAALCASEQERANAMELHRRTLPGRADPAQASWVARARAVGCTTWAMAEFSAAEATVHAAMGRRHHPDTHRNRAADLATPPAYVRRAHDPAVRGDVDRAAAGKLRGLILLRGTSSTGKTRSLFEAVRARCPGWMVIRPRDATAARGLLESGLLDRPLVVWLNELQQFLGPNGQGLSIDVLRDLYTAATAPVVLVGTLWPDKLHTATDPRDDTRSDTRELLAEATPWVHWHDVPRTLTTDDEKKEASRLAANDGRLVRAVADPDRVGFAQTLAGARELLEHYYAARNEPARLLFEAAADARRLGHAHALTEPLLHALTWALWRESHGPQRPPDSDWFRSALTYAVAPLRSDDGVRALIPLADPDTSVGNTVVPSTPSGYDLADYLEQHLIQARRLHPVADGVWEALRARTSRPDDLRALAHAARARGRYRHAEALWRAAAAAGDAIALNQLAGWLSTLPGRKADAEAAWRGAAAGGDSTALNQLARWLRAQPGRQADAEAAWREAAAAGYAGALAQLGRWLGEQPGRQVDAEKAWREAAAGYPSALRELAGWLRDQPRREDEAVAVYREAAVAGDATALLVLALWLRYKPGRPDEAEKAWREAAAAGNPFALREFAKWLSGLPARRDDAEKAWREAAAAGAPGALSELGWWLGRQPGRQSDAEGVWREAAAAGAPEALGSLAVWLSHQPGRETDAEAAWREAAAAGAPEALPRLGWWLGYQPGRETDAEAAWREAAAAGDPTALRELAKWLRDQPGRETDAEAAWREAAAAGDPEALGSLAVWLGYQPGRETDAEAAWREAAAAGDPEALPWLARWLRGQPGRQADAEAVWREAAAVDPTALRELAKWLRDQPGREADVEATWREAAAAGDPTALRELAKWLRDQPGREAEAYLIQRHGLDEYQEADERALG